MLQPRWPRRPQPQTSGLQRPQHQHGTTTLAKSRKDHSCLSLRNVIGASRALAMQLFVVIVFLTVYPLESAQYIDEPYVVKPTPALHVGAEDLTTVLLVNNMDRGRIADNYGRFLSVRPEVGLLTSTARTFIQEGITTEYATQVVGTTLDNGRLYAQYLKKSSRVLYDQDQERAKPSVVTSWVGEMQQTRSLLQNHNDLVDAEAPDWHDIDDSLRVDRNEFVSNTDFVGHKSNESIEKTSVDPDIKIVSMVSSLSAKPLSVNILGRSGQLEENPRKLAAQKVLPIGDLPTYTIKNQFEPSGWHPSNDETTLIHENAVLSAQFHTNLTDVFERSPKLYYQHLSNSGNNAVRTAQDSLMINTLPKRILSTVTYYGFADFTTIVGDSVIVFSPSTAQTSANLGHVTSIKGEATLEAHSGAYSSTDNIDGMDLINPTTIKSVNEISETYNNAAQNTAIVDDLAMKSTVLVENFTNSNKEEESNQGSVQLYSSENVPTVMPSSSNGQTSVLIESDKQTDTKVMYSLPTNQEILAIYASLAKNQAKNSNIEDTVNKLITDSQSINAESIEQPVIGGATTIFFEDDPFENFLESTQTATNTVQTIVQASSLQDVETTTKMLLNTPHPDLSMTDEIESATEDSLSTTASEFESDTSSVDISDGTESSTTSLFEVKDNETVKKIHFAEEDFSELPSNNNVDCSQTSQVFLTQIPKTITVFNTLTITDNNEIRSTIEASPLPTYDIIETTRLYCLETSSTKTDLENNTPQIEKPLAVDDGKDNNLSSENPSPTMSSTDMSNLTETTTEIHIDENDNTTVIIPNEQDSENDYADDYEEAEHVTLSSTESDENEDTDLNDDDSGEEIELIYKTFYTTYTYLTTFFQGEGTTVSSHTEVVTNVITTTVTGVNEKITASTISKIESENEIKPTSIQHESQKNTFSKYMVPNDVENFVRAETNSDLSSSNDVNVENLLENTNTLYLDDSKYTTQTYFTTYTYYTTIFAEGETEIMSRTEVLTNIVTTDYITSLSTNTKLQTNKNTAVLNENQTSVIIETINVANTKNYEINNHVDIKLVEQKSNNGIQQASIDDQAVTLITDVKSSSSDGDHQLLNKNNESVDDQVSSESNTDEIIPSATLLLQTSFTTFTYYTTMYIGDDTNIVSRLETITNVATETLNPTKSTNLEEGTLPITYFTTFTYWTKLAKNGEISTVSREETISNIVLPTKALHLKDQEETLILTQPTKEIAEVAQVEHVAPSVRDSTIQAENSSENSSTVTNEPFNISASNFDPTTFYTTFTYYTTSYDDDDKTILNSHLETITNVITPSMMVSATILQETESNTVYLNEKSINNQQNLILYDNKKIIDADGVSTLYFITQISPTIGEDGIATEATSSTSSLYIDDAKKALQTHSIIATEASDSTTRQYRTGLVRLIQGTRIGNKTTTLYQSKVIGTVIDNRYAQIIESTSSFLYEKSNAFETQINAIEPTNMVSNFVSSTIHHSDLQFTQEPAVESSINDSENVDEVTTEHQRNDDYDSDLSINTKKRTFAPVIRPFASRNRPTFAPKQKTLTPSSATIITRSDITPTITATPALKTGVGQYGSSRRNNISNTPLNPSEVSSSRRFGRPIKSSSSLNAAGPQSTVGFAPSRSRFSSSRVSSSLTGSKRQTVSFRPSSSINFRTGFSSFNLANSRQRIKPTSIGGIIATGSTVSQLNATSVENSAEGDILIEEQLINNDEETTTENSRRNQNPLLRFRRPLNRPSGFTPAQRNNNSNVTISPKRNPLAVRAKSTSTTTTTTTTTSRPRSFQRPTALNLQPRSRQQSNLFPPRGLFQTQKPQTLDTYNNGTDKTNEDISDDPDNDSDNDSEYDDEDEDDEDESNRRRRSNNKSTKPQFLSKPHTSRLNSEPRTRVRRQADSLQSTRSRFRFRRPKIAAPALNESPKLNEDADLETTSTTPVTRSGRSGSRFGSRQPVHYTSTSSTAAITPNQRNIRPTRPTSARTQFTLREKDTTTPQKGLTRPNGASNFRRLPSSGATSSTLRRPTTPSATSRRLKSYNSVSKNSDTLSRNSQSSSRSRNGNLNGTSRGRTSVRGRPRNNDNNDQISSESEFSKKGSMAVLNTFNLDRRDKKLGDENFIDGHEKWTSLRETSSLVSTLIEIPGNRPETDRWLNPNGSNEVQGIFELDERANLVYGANFDEARYNLATRIMSNGVEVIIASEKMAKITGNDNITSPNIQSMKSKSSGFATQGFKPMTLAPSTLKNQMSLSMPSNAQENLIFPINSNQFITKTCLTTYTYRTTYLENDRTTVESREKIISNIATEERNFFKMSTGSAIAVTLARTPELVVGVFPTTFHYYNTVHQHMVPTVVTSSYIVINTVTAPDDYISFLQPSEEATATLDTNTYYSKIVLTKTVHSGNVEDIATTENILTQVVVTESFPPRSTSILKSYYAFDTDETMSVRPTKSISNSYDRKPSENSDIVTYLHTYTAQNGNELIESIIKTLPTRHMQSQGISDFNDLHIYATKTFLTTFTYYTTSPFKAGTPTSSQQTTMHTNGNNFRTRVIENIVTDTVPPSLLRSELISKMHSQLQQKKQGKNQRRVIVTVATLIGGQTLEITAVNMIKPTTIAAIVTKSTEIKGSIPSINEKTSSSSLLKPQNILQKVQVNISAASDPITNVKTTTSPTLSSEVAIFTVPDENYTVYNMDMNSSDDDYISGSENNPIYAVPLNSVLAFRNNTKIHGSITNNTVVPPLSTTVNQIFGSFNLQRLRPMFNAVAGLLQTNLNVNRPSHTQSKSPITLTNHQASYGPQSYSSTSTVEEGKNALKNISTYSFTESPIYIPFMNNRYESVALPEYVDKFPINEAKLTSSLHISPPLSEVELLAHGEGNDDNWLKESPYKGGNLLASNRLVASNGLTDKKTAMLNNGISIRPGEVITTNSDVIIGRPNGIQVPSIPLQPPLLDDAYKLNRSTKNQNQTTNYKQSFMEQHPFRKKTVPSDLAQHNVIPLIELPPTPPFQRVTTDNYDNILRPPPVIRRPLSTKPIYNFNKNNIIDIKRAPEVFSTSIISSTETTTRNGYQWSNNVQNDQKKHLSHYFNNKNSTSLNYDKHNKHNTSSNYVAHQRVKLKTNVLSHNVAMNVPPLTFKKDSDDYPHSPATIHGQRTPLDNSIIPQSISQVNIPLNEYEVQVRLTPQKVLSPIVASSVALKDAHSSVQHNVPTTNKKHLQHLQIPRQETKIYNNRKYTAAQTAIGSFNMPLNKFIRIPPPEDDTIKFSSNFDAEGIVSNTSSHLKLTSINPTINWPSMEPLQNQIPNQNFETHILNNMSQFNSKNPKNSYDIQSASDYQWDVVLADEEFIGEHHDQKTSDTMHNLYTSNSPTLFFNESMESEEVNNKIRFNKVQTQINPQPTKWTSTRHESKNNSIPTNKKIITAHRTVENKTNSINYNLPVYPLKGSAFVANRNNINKTKGIHQNISKQIVEASGEIFTLKNESAPFQKSTVVYAPKQSDFKNNNAYLSLPPPASQPSRFKNSKVQLNVLGLSPPPTKTSTATYSNNSQKQRLRPDLLPNLTFPSSSRNSVVKTKQISSEVLKPPPLMAALPNFTNTSVFNLTKTLYQPMEKISSTILKTKLLMDGEDSNPQGLNLKNTSANNTVPFVKSSTEKVIIPTRTQKEDPTRFVHSTLQTIITDNKNITKIKIVDGVPHTSVSNSLLSLEPSEPTLRENLHISSSDIQQQPMKQSASRNKTDSMHNNPYSSLFKTQKSIVLPTKYVTNILTVTTTKTTVLTSTTPQHDINRENALEKIREQSNNLPILQPTTYLITKTERVVNTVTEIHTNTVVLELTTKLATPSAAVPLLNHDQWITDSKQLELLVDTIRINKIQNNKQKYTDIKSSLGTSTTRPQTTVKEIFKYETNIPQSSIEIVSNDKLNEDYKVESMPTTEQSSIFIVMTNNNMGHIGIRGHDINKSDLQSDVASDLDTSVVVPLDYDENISFELTTRDDETLSIDAGASKDNQVLLGGVLISTPPRFAANYNVHLNKSKSKEHVCHPTCKSARNEICEISTGRCVCRPGFARMFPDRPCKPTYTYVVGLHTHNIGNYNLKYNDQLNNNTTDEYRYLSTIILDAIDRMVMQSDFRDVYHGVQLSGFDNSRGNNDVISNFLLQLSENSDERRLRSVFGKYLRKSNYSIGGTELFTTNEGAQNIAIQDFNECVNSMFHDCSPHAQCINLQGTYACSCVLGYADLSSNSIYPGRICSKELVGCSKCHYHGKCIDTQPNTIVCECFAWYTGSYCQLNLKVLLITLITIGTMLFILLIFCLILTNVKRRRRQRHTSLATSQIFIASSLHPSLASTVKKSRLSSKINHASNMKIRSDSLDKHAIIKDSSSESSQNTLSYAMQNSTCKKETCLPTKLIDDENRCIKSKLYQKHGPYDSRISSRDDVAVLLPSTYYSHQTSSTEFDHSGVTYPDQSDRSLTVMIPRAKYHPSVQPQKQILHQQHMTCNTDKRVKNDICSKGEGDQTNTVLPSHAVTELSTTEIVQIGTQTNIVKDNLKPPTVDRYSSLAPGALVSAGFEVSAIVGDLVVPFTSLTDSVTDAQSNSANNSSSQEQLFCAPEAIFPQVTNVFNNQYNENNMVLDNNKTHLETFTCSKEQIKSMSAWLSNMQKTSVSAEARSFDETTIQAATKPVQFVPDSSKCHMNEEANTMTERDIGSTFLLPHTHLYKHERESDLSGFDSM